MRRLLCLMLLAGFGLPLVAPLLALAQGPEAALPACCRRAGQHHCAMGMTAIMAGSSTESQSPHWAVRPVKCPFCPDLARGVSRHDVAAAASAEMMVSFEFARPLGKAQTESRRRIARERSRHKRGPPALSLA